MQKTGTSNKAMAATKIFATLPWRFTSQSVVGACKADSTCALSPDVNRTHALCVPPARQLCHSNKAVRTLLHACSAVGGRCRSWVGMYGAAACPLEVADRRMYCILLNKVFAVYTITPDCLLASPNSQMQDIRLI